MKSVQVAETSSSDQEFIDFARYPKEGFLTSFSIIKKAFQKSKHSTEKLCCCDIRFMLVSNYVEHVFWHHAFEGTLKQLAHMHCSICGVFITSSYFEATAHLEDCCKKTETPYEDPLLVLSCRKESIPGVKELFTARRIRKPLQQDEDARRQERSLAFEDLNKATAKKASEILHIECLVNPSDSNRASLLKSIILDEPRTPERVPRVANPSQEKGRIDEKPLHSSSEESEDDMEDFEPILANPIPKKTTSKAKTVSKGKAPLKNPNKKGKGEGKRSVKNTKSSGNIATTQSAPLLIQESR